MARASSRCVRALSLVLLLSLPAAASAIAPGDNQVPDCGAMMAIGYAGNAAVFGLLAIPAMTGDDREVRLAAGAGVSHRSNIVTGGDPRLLMFRTGAVDANRATLADAAWSMSARRRLGDSRFQYRAFATNLLHTGACPTELEGSSRLVSGIGAELIRGVFTLELGLGLHHAFNAIGMAYGLDRVLFGGAPFVRLALQPTDSFTSLELVAFYLLGVASSAVQHSGQLDLIIQYRPSPSAGFTATIRGEVGHSEHGVFYNNTVLKLSSSVLLGARF